MSELSEFNKNLKKALEMNTKEIAQKAIYMPILKSKMGELNAIKELDIESKSKMFPLFEIHERTYDWNNENYTTTYEKHLTKLVSNIDKSWHNAYKIAIDCNSLDDFINPSTYTLHYLLGVMIEKKLNPIPVFSLDTDFAVIGSIAPLFKDEMIENVCIRVKISQIIEYDLQTLIDAIKSKLDINEENVILLFDIEYMSHNQIATAQMATIMYLSGVPNLKLFNELFVSVTSFPINLANIGTNVVHTIDRIDTSISKFINSNKNRFKRIPKYSDYVIANPEINIIDPRIMTMSASIRYSAIDKWYIFKGQSTKKKGFEQFYKLSKDVVNHPCYLGEDYSWGDKFIKEKSLEQGTTGNATTWRKVATNHHLKLMINHLSS